MKPFDPTKPVQTRDGRKARIICTDRRDVIFPIVALIEEGDMDRVLTYYANGSHEKQPSDADLINVPAEFERAQWVNVYPLAIAFWDSKETADHGASPGRIACVQIVVKGKEGDGL